jgi:nicotinamidase-related amidase
MRLNIQNSCLVLIDVQGKLAALMHDKERLFVNLVILVKGARILGVPIVWCEQNPRALGPTIPELVEHLSGLSPIEKMSFSCCGDPAFDAALHKIQRGQAVLCGIESHVCVYQTAADLKAKGLEVAVVADAVSSRSDDNKQIALARMQAEGVCVTSTEMLLFEWMQTARHGQFKDIAKLVR